MDENTPYIEVKKCRCCGSDNLTSVLDMADMPLANGFHMGEVQAKFPLEMMVCKNCFHGQLSVVVSGKIMFANYAYMSSVSNTFRDHCEGLVADATSRVAAKPRVLDIAANDGLLLSIFKQKADATVLGVDPADNLKPYTDKLEIPMVHAFWSEKLAKSLNRKFDIITAQNVFGHVHDLKDFLKGCDAALDDDGIAIIEFAYSMDLVLKNEFDTIYHEHLSYFLINSFATLVKGTDFFIDDIIKTPIHGGSVRFVLKKKPGRNAPIVNKLIEIERQNGLFDMSTYEQFRANVGQNRQAFRKLVAELQDKNERVIGYCASAKGITMLNYFDIDLDYIVDDTELKQGRLIPGKDTPIVKPEVLAQEKRRENMNIVVLAWNFMDEIKQRIQSIRGSKDTLLLYVPTVEKISL